MNKAVVAQRPEDQYLATLQGNKMQAVLKRVLPEYMRSDRFLATAVAAAKVFASKPNVVKESILVAVFDAARLGLVFGDNIGHCYMVPFEAKKTGRSLVQLLTGYKGLIHLAKRGSDALVDIRAFFVFRKEAEEGKFEQWNDETGSHFKHVPDLTLDPTKDELAGGYCLYWLKGEVRPRYYFIPIEKILRVEKGALRRGGAVWSNPDTRPDMILKTIYRQTLKTLDLSPDLNAVIAREEKMEVGKIDAIVPDELDGVVDAHYEEVVKEVVAESESTSTKPVVAEPVVGKADEFTQILRAKGMALGCTNDAAIEAMLQKHFKIDSIGKVPKHQQNAIIDWFESKAEGAQRA